MKIVREFNNVKLEIELTEEELTLASKQSGALMNEWDAALMMIEELDLYHGSPYGHAEECIRQHYAQVERICQIVNKPLVNWNVDDEPYHSLIINAIHEVCKKGENA